MNFLDLENRTKLDVSFLEAKSKKIRREFFRRKKVNLYNNPAGAYTWDLQELICWLVDENTATLWPILHPFGIG